MSDPPSSSTHSEEPDGETASTKGGGADGPATEFGPPKYRGEKAGDWIGPYKLLAFIKEGGFGAVWLAERREPFVQRVALKIIKAGMDSKAVLSRFDQERQALALMDHPCIAKVFDGGLTQKTERPYFAMEYVKGLPITEHCDRGNLPIDERIQLFVQVCDAVQHAHLRGIIHRDLKPGNILVAAGDATTPAVPKVIDFGIAKALNVRLVDCTIVTEEGQTIGTWEYMSPEQAVRDASDIDYRADVYSLGVLLYQLLTGHLPLNPRAVQQAGDDAMREFIRTREPPKPSTRVREHNTGETRDIPPGRADTEAPDSTEVAKRRGTDAMSLERLVRGALDWITLTAMEKERKDRYKSPADLASDLRCYLRGDPVTVGPRGLLTELRRLVRRYRKEVALGGAFLALLVAGFVTTFVQYLEAREARGLAVKNEGKAVVQKTIAEKKAKEASWQAYVANIAAADTALRIGDAERAIECLRACPAEHRSWDWSYLSSISDSSERTITLKGDWPIGLSIPAAALGAAVLGHSRLELWPPEDGTVPGVVDFAAAETVNSEKRDVLGVTIDPSATFLVTKHRQTNSLPCELWLTSAKDGTHTRLLSRSCWEDAADRRCAVFDRDGTRVAVREGDETASRILIYSTTTASVPVTVQQAALCFAFEGSTRVVLGDDALSYYSTTTGARLGQHLPVGGAGPVETIVVDAAGKWAATSARGVTDVWDLATGRRIGGFAGSASALLFLADGRLLAGVGSDVVIADPLGSVSNSVLHGHGETIVCLAEEPGSGTIWSGAKDGTVRAWNPRASAFWPGVVSAHNFRLDPARPRVTVIGEGAVSVDVLDERGEKTASYPHPTDAAAYSPDGAFIALAAAGHPVALVNTSTGAAKHLLVPDLDPETFTRPKSQDSLLVSFVGDSSRLLVVGDIPGGLGAWMYDTGSGEIIKERTFQREAGEKRGFRALAVSRRGDTIAISDRSNLHVIAVDPDDGMGLDLALFRLGRSPESLAFDPAARRLAAVLSGFNRLSDEHEVAVLELATQSTLTLRCRAQMHDAAWSVDGSRLIYGGRDGVLRVWDAEHNAALLSIPVEGRVLRIDLALDGSRIGALHDTGRLWRVKTAGKSQGE